MYVWNERKKTSGHFFHPVQVYHSIITISQQCKYMQSVHSSVAVFTTYELSTCALQRSLEWRVEERRQATKAQKEPVETFFSVAFLSFLWKILQAQTLFPCTETHQSELLQSAVLLKNVWEYKRIHPSKVQILYSSNRNEFRLTERPKFLSLSPPPDQSVS